MCSFVRPSPRILLLFWRKALSCSDESPPPLPCCFGSQVLAVALNVMAATLDHKGGHVIYKGGRSIYKGARRIYKGGWSIYKGVRSIYKGGRRYLVVAPARVREHALVECRHLGHRKRFLADLPRKNTRAHSILFFFVIVVILAFAWAPNPKCLDRKSNLFPESSFAGSHAGAAPRPPPRSTAS